MPTFMTANKLITIYGKFIVLFKLFSFLINILGQTLKAIS